MARKVKLRSLRRHDAHRDAEFVRKVWSILSLLAVTVLAYLPTLDAGFIWDDDFHVIQHDSLRGLRGLRRIWFDPSATPQYYPLTHTTFWVESYLWGLKPAGYHVVNVILHAANAVLLWRTLRYLALPGAWWAAAVFALHPLNVESVAWITERKNVLSLLFYLAAAIVWLRCLKHEAAKVGACRSRRSYTLFLSFFVAALLSKTVSGSLPAALLVVAWWQQGAVSKRELKLLAPLFALAIAAGWMTSFLEARQVGARGPEWDFTIADRLIIAGRAVWFYAGKLVWPTSLSFIYPRWQIDASDIRQYVYPLAAAGLIAVLWLLRRRLGRGPLAAALFYGGTLVPALGFVNVYPMRYSFVADHFQYVAGIGLIVLMTSAASELVRRIPADRRWGGSVLSAALLLTLMLLTWRRTHVYAGELTLWSDTVAKNPAWMPYLNLGNALAVQKRFPEAVEAFVRSLALRPDNVQAHMNLGSAWEAQGNWEQASTSYQRALELDPSSVYARGHLAMVLVKLQRTGDAIVLLQELVAEQTHDAEIRNNFGIALEAAGRREEACEHYRRAIELDPDFPGAHYNLANCHFANRRFREARREYERALALQPTFGDARNNFAAMLLAEADDASRAGDRMLAAENLQGAIRQYLAWLRHEPGSVIALQNLAGVYERLELWGDATVVLEQAARLDPENTVILNRLNNVRSRPQAPADSSVR